MELSDLLTYISENPEIAQEVRNNLSDNGLTGAVNYTDEDTIKVVEQLYYYGPGYAAAVLPESLWKTDSSAQTRRGNNQKGFFGNLFEGLGNVVTGAVGSAANLVGAIGTNAQANAANAQAIAQYNAQIAAGNIPGTAPNQRPALGTVEIAAIIGGVLLIAVIIFILIRNKGGS